MRSTLLTTLLAILFFSTSAQAKKAPEAAPREATFSAAITYTENPAYQPFVSKISIMPCLDAAIEREPGLSKAVAFFNVEIRPDGKVAWVTTMKSEGMSAELEACSRSAIEVVEHSQSEDTIILPVIVIYRHGPLSSFNAPAQ